MQYWVHWQKVTSAFIFPPSDPQWRGASSDRFLAFAVERVRARGGRIAHLDVTIVCEVPRIGPHRDAMRTRIAEIAKINVDRIAVKATTSETLVSQAAAKALLPLPMRQFGCLGRTELRT